jgi:hypothetical protein
MTTTEKVTFRKKLGEAGEKLSEIMAFTPKLKDASTAKECVLLMDELTEMMHEAQMSVTRATRLVETAAGYAPYRGKAA